MEGVMDGRVARPGIYGAGREVLGIGFPYLERVWGGGIGLKGGETEEVQYYYFEASGEKKERELK